jgi:erythromycin esterase
MTFNFAFRIALSLVASLTLSSPCCAQLRHLKNGYSGTDAVRVDSSVVYTVEMKKDEFLRCVYTQDDADMFAYVVNGSQDTVGSFNAPVGFMNDELIEWIAPSTGTYTVHISGISYSGLEPRDGSIPIFPFFVKETRILSHGEYKTYLKSESAEKEAFHTWIKTKSHPIRSLDSASPDDDLQPIIDAVRHKRVIALGESSHGTAEFYRIKQRVIASMVSELGVKSFYMEASMRRCEYINDYITLGKGSLDTATAIHGFVNLRVEEFRDLLKWMRSHNEKLPSDRQLRFYGFDLQRNEPARDELRAYLRKYNLDRFADLDRLFAVHDSAILLQKKFEHDASTELFKTITEDYRSAFNDFLLNRGKYSYQSGIEGYNRNLMNFKLLLQEVESNNGSKWQLRDYYMAENVLELLSSEDKNNPVILFGHNIHFSRINEMMGDYLNKVLKDDYYVLGLEYGQGTILSRNLSINRTSRHWNICKREQEPSETLPGVMRTCGIDMGFIDFLSTNPPSYYKRDIGMHVDGSVYIQENHSTALVPLHCFDGLIYIENSTAATDFTKVVFQ